MTLSPYDPGPQKGDVTGEAPIVLLPALALAEAVVIVYRFVSRAFARFQKDRPN